MYVFPVTPRSMPSLPTRRSSDLQSLHTSVVSERGFPFEVQIRSAEMHRIAEEGIAAHWKYKEGRVGADRDEQCRGGSDRSEEHTSELQSPCNLVCRLLLETK